MRTAVVAGVATGIAITEAEKLRQANEKKYQEEQDKLPGNGEKCTDKCKKDFICYNEKCLSTTEYNIATSPKGMDPTTLALIIVLPTLTILLILAGVFEPQIREFFKKAFKK